MPREVASDPEEVVGPRLYEQTDYRLYARVAAGHRVAIAHRDPVICNDLGTEDGGRVIHGYVNFGSQIGRSVFTLLVDDQPEYDFEVEVFPTKLDYQSDYQQLLAEVQDILTGLALEYLRSTFSMGTPAAVPQPTHLEWLTLLRNVADELELGLRYVAHHPLRTLTREWSSIRAERVRRCDSAVRAAVRRGSGSGRLVKLDDGLAVREWLHGLRARATLDTPEHRWLAAQLGHIRRRIGWLRREEAAREASDRRRETLRELNALEERVVRLSRLEPLVDAKGDPPPGFASLQLLSAPGYREAYRACLVLSLGLRLENGPIRLSLKDLSLLYEYWCYLALLRLVSEETGQEIPTQDLFAVRQRGLQVMLHRGRITSMRFQAHSDRTVEVTYNPLFGGASSLILQRPDMLVTFEEHNWPRLHLVLDAKYRVDATNDYVARYGSPGPPEDALNVLHRYRDAILEDNGAKGTSERPKHTVVQAAAAFPYRGESSQQYREGRLWKALEQLGVGAVPLLPGSTEYLLEWLRSALRRGGWALADRAIPHEAWERARQWRVAASEAVLVAVLRGGEEAEHLDWIRRHRQYYMPLLKTQRRQYVTTRVALYLSGAFRQPPAVTHSATVERIEVVKRGDIRTPWATRRAADTLCVLYHLGPLVELPAPIENPPAAGVSQRFSRHRWTSWLSLQRARTLKELLLETEQEWRLYEDLGANGVVYTLMAGPVTVSDPDDPRGRAWFVMPDGFRVRYAGAAGFLTKRRGHSEQYVARADDVLKLLSESGGGV